MTYIGDFPQDQTIYHKWATNTGSGASVTRATDGTIHVYKDDATGTEVTTGITNTEDFDSLTGVHQIKIVTTDVFYAPACDYTVVLKAAVIDGQTVNVPIFSFSIENRTGSPQAGALEITYTVYKEEAKINVLEGCQVWVTKANSSTAPVVFSGVTDSNGILVDTLGSSKPWLDAGTYYFWRQKSNYNFSNPDTETFS
ncbi:MAG: hypothetical protein ACYS30_26020 [Planctomycetota bacterium]|jgi:hypothetical protein